MKIIIGCLVWASGSLAGLAFGLKLEKVMADQPTIIKTYRYKNNKLVSSDVMINDEEKYKQGCGK